MKHVVVTGGAGYIGSHVCKALAQAGYLPVSLDNLSRGHAGAVKWGPLEINDIRETDRVAEFLDFYAPSAVIHLAGLAYVRESMSDPHAYYEANVMGTLSLLEAMRRCSIKNIVFASSCAVYGTPPRLECNERTPRNPDSTYGRTKAAAEDIIQSYRDAFRIRPVVLRFFNAAGADPDGEIGEQHKPEPHLIPNVLAAASGGPPLVIHGQHHATPDGTCVRDYVHVTDLAKAHVLALQHLERDGLHDTFNLGNGQGHSVFEVIRAAIQVTGRDITCQLGPRRNGDAVELISDSTRAREVLGWNPQYSDIETILRTAWAWHKKGLQIAHT